MAGKSKALEASLLNYVMRGQSMLALTDLYLALYTSATTDAGGGTEVSGNGYARIKIDRTTGAWSAPVDDGSDGQKASNTAELQAPESTGAWGTVTHGALMSAATGGTQLYHAALNTSRNVDSAGIVIRFKPGDITVSEK